MKAKSYLLSWENDGIFPLSFFMCGWHSSRSPHINLTLSLVNLLSEIAALLNKLFLVTILLLIHGSVAVLLLLGHEFIVKLLVVLIFFF